jgi:hypothetical protein
MIDQDCAPLVHDFEELLRYAGENKIILTPKQKFIPLRHIKAIIGQFRINEAHEYCIGEKVFKKRDEMEYSRFYFLDLLAIEGNFLKVTGKNVLTKGAHWKTFFAAEPKERGFLLFHALRYNFNFANWLLRGGDFGEQLEEKAELIWARIFQWRDGAVVIWRLWAEDVIRSCGLHWNSPDQTFANDLAIWGLEYCFFKSLKYFGLVEAEKREGEFSRLMTFRLNPTGREYFSRILRKSGYFAAVKSPFSLN